MVKFKEDNIGKSSNLFIKMEFFGIEESLKKINKEFSKQL